MNNGGKKIGILTTFYNIDNAYSLCSIVVDQLTTLKKHGYNPVFLVHDNFKDDEKVPEGIEIRKIIPRFKLVDYAATSTLADDFESQVDEVVSSLEKNCQDIDVMITHDIIFQGWFLPYNVAIRKAKLNCKWLHWIHSAPSPRPAELKYPFDCRFTIPPNSKLVYLNHTDVIRLAEMYGAWPKDVRVVHNPKDPRTFWNLHPLTSDLIDKYGILEKDILSIYPLSTPRMVSGKGVDKAIKLIGKMKKLGKKVCLVVCNAHANGEKDKELVKQMVHYGIEQGLDQTDLIFTSTIDKQWELGVPPQVVSELFRLSNIFVFPSYSENCSLVMLEAALSKNLLVLNEDFPPMKDFFQEQALYFRFGSLCQKTVYNNEDQFYEDVAKIVLSEIKENKLINSFTKMKQKFNLDAIFKDQIEPLLYE
jgi:glycosyltransferase involved in cell wall biosynthesis